MNNAVARGKRKIGLRNQLLFYCLILAVPTVQFCIFYLAVNVNSILLAFKQYNPDGSYTFIGFENFAKVFSDLTHVQYLKAAFWNSLLLGFFTLAVGMTLALIFSYYIYKNAFLSGVFKVVLFLPQIVSALVMVVMFKYFAEDMLPTIVLKLFGTEMRGLISDSSTQFPTILVYSLWVGFGPQILMYSGAMSGISESIIEAGKLDGISPLKEFFRIVIPMIWSTVVSFIVVNLAQVFVNQMQLFSFFGTEAEYSLYTLGYYLYSAMKRTSTELSDYPYLASFGLTLTLFTIPVTLIARKLLERAFRVE